MLAGGSIGLYNAELQTHIFKGDGTKGEVLGNLREPAGVLGKIREYWRLLCCNNLGIRPSCFCNLGFLSVCGVRVMTRD